MAVNEQTLKFFADFIQKNLGIVYSQTNYFQLEKRLEDVVKIMHYQNVDELFRQAQTGITGHLRQVLLDISTNNETSFFRDPAIYKAIEDKIFPGIVANNPGKTNINVWCCASSFGQEPYSLSILSGEFLQKNPAFGTVSIYASDISENALNRAKAGKYSQLEVQRGLSAQRLIKHFRKDESDHWTVSSEVSQRVKFGRQNLLEPFVQVGPFDLVSCRYVLIYQTDEMKKQIIGKLAKVLAPRGYLILGGTESMFGLSQDFEQVSHSGAIIYQKKSAA